jgi:hypothetical protein
MSIEPRAPRKTLKLPPYTRPCVCKPTARRPWIAEVEHILVDAGNPGPAGNKRNDGCSATDRGWPADPANELGANEGAGAVDLALLHLLARAQNRHAGLQPVQPPNATFSCA